MFVGVYSGIIGATLIVIIIATLYDGFLRKRFMNKQVCGPM